MAKTRGVAAKIFRAMASEYPDARCDLRYRDPWQLLVATILSAQCTDAQVNAATPALFARLPDAASTRHADRAVVEALIRSTGFFRVKAENIQRCAAIIEDEHQGTVPDDLESLVALPGVGRKTANVVLGEAFGRPAVVVDTHVKRLSRRIGLSAQEDPARIEADLRGVFARSRWSLLAHLFIRHGRAVCAARRPRCQACVIARWCDKIGAPADSSFSPSRPASRR